MSSKAFRRPLRGEVFSMILSQKRFTEANAATLGAQMLASIDYIHKKGVMLKAGFKVRIA